MENRQRGIFQHTRGEMEVDYFGASEINLQWDMTWTSPIKILGLKKGSRSAYVCNKNKRINEKQRGGTCITLKEQYGQNAK